MAPARKLTRKSFPASASKRNHHCLGNPALITSWKSNLGSVELKQLKAAGMLG